MVGKHGILIDAVFAILILGGISTIVFVWYVLLDDNDNSDTAEQVEVEQINIQDIQMLLRKKNKSIEDERALLKAKAQRNLEFLIKLSTIPELVDFLKSGQLLYVDLRHDIRFAWLPHNKRVIIQGIQWDWSEGDKEVNIDAIGLDGIRGLAELTEERILLTIKRQIIKN